MRRRAVITLIGCGIASALWPQRTRSADKVYRIAFVVPFDHQMELHDGATQCMFQSLSRIRIARVVGHDSANAVIG